MHEPDGADDEDDGASEQDLVVVLKLSNRQMGTQTERIDIERFAESLAEAVEDAGVGEYDGDEMGGGECTLFFCGPDLDKLTAVLRPLLKRSPLTRGAHFTRMVEGPDGEFTPQQFPI